MIKYIIGDLLESNADVILHQVNCKGVMGGGVARQIRNKYPKVYEEYKSLCATYTNRSEILLGRVESVVVNERQIVVNLFAQNDFGTDKRQTDYEALRQCLKKVNSIYRGNKVALPFKIGCGLGGGDWFEVLSIIEEELCDCDVLIYKLS